MDVAKLQIEADSRQIKTASKQLDNFTKSGERAEKSSNKLKTATGRLSDEMRKLGRIVGAIVTTLAIASVLHLADSYQALQTRIKTATAATGTYVETSKKILEISRQTGSELESTVSLFQGVARGARELGKTDQDILKLARTVQQLGVIGGSSAESISAGTRQLGQALASGVLRGDELNSILENLPELAARIAAGLGVGVGQLRAMGAAGKLTSEAVFDSLLKQIEEINKEFEKLPPTIDRAFNSLKVTAQAFVGEVDKSLGLTQGLAEEIKGISDSLYDLIKNPEGIREFVNLISQIASHIDEAAIAIVGFAAAATFGARLNAMSAAMFSLSRGSIALNAALLGATI